MDSSSAHKSFAELIAGSQPVLIDFYADWNDPSKAVKPILEGVNTKMKGKMILLKIDVDKNPKMARLYNIKSVPTLLLFKNNTILWRQEGIATAQTVEKIILDNL